MNEKTYKNLLLNIGTYNSNLNLTCQYFIKCLQDLSLKISHQHCFVDTMIITEENNSNHFNIYDIKNNSIFNCQNSLRLYHYFNLGKNLLRICPNITLHDSKCLYFDKFTRNISKNLNYNDHTQNNFLITNFKDLEKLVNFQNEINQNEFLFSNPIFIIFFILVLLSSFGILAVIYIAFANTKNVDPITEEEIELN